MKIGDSVKVNAGVLEPDTEKFEIGGWQGRIVEIDTVTTGDGTLLNIEWDVITLNQIPAEYIIQSEVEGLGWDLMVLFESDVVKTEPRDTVSDVKKMQGELMEKYYWSHLGEEGQRIAAVLEGTDRNEEMASFYAWNNYMEKNLTFPFQAVVMEAEANTWVKEGTELMVNSLSNVDEVDGILIDVTLNGEKSDFMLCDVEPIDKKSANFQFINDYSVWFANMCY